MVTRHSARECAPDQRQEKYRDIDRKAEVPEDRAQPRTIAEIGEDIGNTDEDKQYREFVDKVLRSTAELGKQDSDREERKSFQTVLMSAQRARADGILVEGGIAWS